MGNEFATGDGLSLSTTTQPGKIRKNFMGSSKIENANGQRDAAQLWAAMWLSAELKGAFERGSRVNAAERA
jgi:hypothetical protein